MTTLKTVTFADFEEPEDDMCHLLYATLHDSVIAYTHAFDNEDTINMSMALEEMHVFVDAFLGLLTELYPHAASVDYLATHDGHQFVFSPCNIFTCKVAAKMDQLQENPIFKFHTTLA